MLSVSNLSKSYGIHQILDQISFTLSAGQRLGIVGANGVGKSTLIKIIAGEIEADSGTISIPSGFYLGYLPQEIIGYDGQSLADLIATSMHHLYELDAQMRQLEIQMGNVEKDELTAILLEYETLTEQFERYGGYEIDYRVDLVLEGLGVGHIPRDREFATLSGGEKSRVGLAMLLLQTPDLLLLDEPTNHLDVRCLEWLENYLQTYRGGVLIVSHDRQFLNRTVTAILEIEEHSRQAKHYAGNYDVYLHLKATERRRWQAAYESQQEEIKALRHEIKVKARQVAHNRPPTDNDKFLKHFKRAQVEQSISRRVQSAEEKLRRIEENPIPRPPDDLRFNPDFDPHMFRGHTPLFVSGLVKKYGSRCLVNEVSFALDSQSRIVLVGQNGVGKSTLLKLLAGIDTPDAGEIYINPQVKIGYLDQEALNLDEHLTVFQAYSDGLDGFEQQLKSMLLSTGLFRYEEIERKVSELSSGQRRKLQIARLMAQKVNLLLLDEPTNYVSFDVLESLEEALRHFPGPIIVVSHDRRFIEHFGGQIWQMNAGKSDMLLLP